MPKISAGILPFKIENNKPLFFLVHPGGPYFKFKDNGFWSICKGEVDKGEEILNAAIREFKEELNFDILNKDDLEYLGEIKQKNYKIVHAWSLKINNLELKAASNLIEIEYPYKSGKFIQVPEIDRGEWFDFETAKLKINPAQIEFLEMLVEKFG